MKIGSLLDGKMSNSNLARVAEKASELYKQSLVENARAIDPFSKEWDAVINIKVAYFKAYAQFCKSQEDGSLQKFGEEQCRLQYAEQVLKKTLESVLTKSFTVEFHTKIKVTFEWFGLDAVIEFPGDPRKGIQEICKR